MNVLALMSTAVQTCQATDTLDQAAALMWQHTIGMVPVLNENGRAVAVITDRDIAMAALLTGRCLREIAVSESMSKSLHTCQTTDPLQVAQARMAATHTRRLLVLNEEGHLCGILSTDDLVRAAASGWRLFALPDLVHALSAVAYAPPPSDDEDDDTQDPEATSVAEGLRDAWQNSIAQLQQRRDTLRLTLHLASMDARTEWDRLEEGLQDLQQRARSAEQRAESGVQSTLHELAEGYRKLRDRIAAAPTPPPPSTPAATPSSKHKARAAGK